MASATVMLLMMCIELRLRQSPRPEPTSGCYGDSGSSRCGALLEDVLSTRHEEVAEFPARRPGAGRCRAGGGSLGGTDPTGRSMQLLLGQESRQVEQDQPVRIELRDDDGTRPAVEDHA